MPEYQFEVGVVPYDRDVGDDGDAPGISQEITVDDLEGIAFSNQPRDQRLRRLREMHSEIYSRQSADRGHDFDGLLNEVERLIAEIDVDGDTDTGVFAAMSGDENLSTMSPDEREDMLDRD
ncbi:hypothetical protein B7H23_02780 [Notoacmeibacter marinus]|uniref:Uncharacterized protein n=1 Tax=Notoacmeibacter marinus TaxID=1876515 RepID=A0A231V108_9HYPH|nr:hypothetical protein [Notoacmeibacter marinus]OXT01889.1 hypothetical protein B7H23_02780 [Notoacmeibacter marinus]